MVNSPVSGETVPSGVLTHDAKFKVNFLLRAVRDHHLTIADSL